MSQKIEIKQIKQLAETLEAFVSNQSLLMKFLPVLEAGAALLQQEKCHLINNHLRLDEQDCALYEATANLYKIIHYHCTHHDPTPQSIKFAQVCGVIEYILMTTVQHSRGCVDESQGYFFASEGNLASLVEASLNVLETTDPTKPIEFVQLA